MVLRQSEPPTNMATHHSHHVVHHQQPDDYQHQQPVKKKLRRDELDDGGTAPPSPPSPSHVSLPPPSVPLPPIPLLVSGNGSSNAHHHFNPPAPHTSSSSSSPPTSDETDFAAHSVCDLSHLQYSLPTLASCSASSTDATVMYAALNTWETRYCAAPPTTLVPQMPLPLSSGAFVTSTNHDRFAMTASPTPPPASHTDAFQYCLIRQCLCAIPEVTLQHPFKYLADIARGGGAAAAASVTMLIEWPAAQVLAFLSQLQLLFDVYLKQNNRGAICARIVYVCDALMRNEHQLVEQIVALGAVRHRYVNYLAAKVLASFLVLAKAQVHADWLDAVVEHLRQSTTDHHQVDYERMNFALEVVKRVVEWKDVDIHVLEESQVIQQQQSSNSIDESSSSSSGFLQNGGNVNEQSRAINCQNSAIMCTTVPFSDPDSYDTSAIKGAVIKSLETSWSELTAKIQYLIARSGDGHDVEAQTCIITFLALWESTISVRANLSVTDTKPFYAHLELFVELLHGNGGSLPAIIWKQLLSLFNEVLCYGSTLALQDMLPEDTCQLATLVVRYVKDYRLLDSLPYRRPGTVVNSFVGASTIVTPSAMIPPGASSHDVSVDRTLLQKMVLLVLKSVAITIKETRSDSSDSSVGSDDFDFYQDMQLIERSIRDVVKKVDAFLKHSLDFHPETPFSKILVHLFSDQDDYMIESLVCTLDITIGLSYRDAVFPDLIAMLNPTFSFVEFLKIVSHDSDVLLDYLVSNETCFLLYLLRYLKYTRRNWSRFMRSCVESSADSRQNELDNTMTVLIRLQMQIKRLVSKDLFPYNINPVLKLLEVCETLYDEYEMSS